MSANGMARPCSYPARRRVLPGITSTRSTSHVTSINAIYSRHNRHRYREEHIPPGWPDQRGNIVLQLKTSRAQLERRLANAPPCLIGMEACSGAHHIGRQLEALGHDARLMPAQYVKPFLKGHKNDYRDAEAIAEAVQRPTMHFVSIKTPDQMDLLALHQVRSRLVSQRTGVINQIRGFLLERGPPRSARWNEEMDERSARRSQETGCHDDPMRSFR